MIRRYGGLILSICLVWSCESAYAADEQGAIEATLRAYEQAWSRHDAREVAGFYYEPAVRVTAGGPVVRATRKDEEEFFATFLPALVKSGYARSTWDSLQVRMLDANTAVASGVTVRNRGDGSVFARVGVTYALYRTGARFETGKVRCPSTEGVTEVRQRSEPRTAPRMIAAICAIDELLNRTMSAEITAIEARSRSGARVRAMPHTAWATIATATSLRPCSNAMPLGPVRACAP